MKYKNPKQVVARLLEGGKLRSMRDLKYKYKETLPDYSEMIGEGISMYEDYVIDQDLRRIFTEEEYNNIVKGKQ